MNAGKYNKLIRIYSTAQTEDEEGFQVTAETLVLTAHASVRTTRGFTLIAGGSDFEKAFTNFTIRFPQTAIDRDMIVVFRGRRYTIEYVNDIDEKHVELELQCKEVTH